MHVLNRFYRETHLDRGGKQGCALVHREVTKYQPCALTKATHPTHVYEVRPRSDKRGVDLISDARPFGRLWYGEPNAVANAIGYAKFLSRSYDAVIRVYDEAGNVIETHEAR